MNREESKEWIKKTCGEGWLSLVDEVFDNLPNGISIREIYQKYAELHVDIDKEDREFEIYLMKVEERSLSICEKCGKPGSHYVIEGWEYARCNEHCENGIDLNDLPNNT